jgi:hypothetical protein
MTLKKIEQFCVLCHWSVSTGNPLRGFPTKNIPQECFSTFLRLEEHKVFRSLRRATKGSAFGNRKLLKKLEQNF